MNTPATNNRTRKIMNFDATSPKKKFDFSITDDTVYYGIDSIDFYSKALLGFNTAKNITLVPNVKSKIKLPQFDMGTGLVQPDSISWNPTGEGTLQQKTFTVCPLKVNLEYSTLTFEQDFLNTYLRPGSNDSDIPDNFMNYIVTQTMKQVANDLENLAWQGTGTGSTYPQDLCQGLIQKMTGDNTTLAVTTTAATSSNVVDIMTALFNKIPEAVLEQNSEDIIFYVNPTLGRAYKVAQTQAAAGQGFNYASDTQELNFLGYKVVVCGGLQSNQAVVANQKNLLLLTDLISDIDEENSLVVIPQFKVSGVPTVRISGRFKFDTDYKIGAEIVVMS